jgi:hypothetical protein
LNVSGSKLKDPNGFEKAWNAVAADLFQKQMEGDDVLLVHRKSAIQLQEHLVDLLETERQAARATPAAENLYKTTVRTVFRESRNQMPLTATPHRVQPTVYPPGEAPLGVPSPLNPHIIAGALRPNPNGGAIPHSLLPVAMAQQLPRPLPADYSRQKYCIKCGLRRKKHKHGEPFGRHCTKTGCGICLQPEFRHIMAGTPMGFWCTLTLNNQPPPVPPPVPPPPQQQTGEL